MRYRPEYIMNIQAAGPYPGRFACKMQVLARSDFTMALLRPVLLRPRNIKADCGHALKGLRYPLAVVVFENLQWSKYLFHL
jgi:hypothetical protein